MYIENNRKIFVCPFYFCYANYVLTKMVKIKIPPVTKIYCLKSKETQTDL